MKTPYFACGLLISCMLSVGCSPDIGYTAVEDLVFEDAAFKACVISEARENGWVNAGQVIKLHCVNPTGQKIASITGIENLHNVRELDLAHNAIADLAPLVALKKLDRLNFDDNRIRQLPDGISHFSVTHLSLVRNMIRDISVINVFQRLEVLNLASNRVNDISALQQNRALQVLNLNQNQVADISPLGSLMKLRELDLGNNRISDLAALESLQQLEHLYLGNNHVSDLSPLAGLSELREIDLANNQVTSIQPLVDLENIWRLSLDHNPIESIEPLLEYSELESISLRGVGNLSCETVRTVLPEVAVGAWIGVDGCPSSDPLGGAGRRLMWPAGVGLWWCLRG